MISGIRRLIKSKLPTRHFVISRNIVSAFRVHLFLSVTSPDFLPSSALVAADPDFDLDAGQAHAQATSETAGVAHNAHRVSREIQTGDLERLGRLPGTRVEGERIARMLSVKPLLGEEALEARIKACRSPRILHLAWRTTLLTCRSAFADCLLIPLSFDFVKEFQRAPIISEDAVVTITHFSQAQIKL